MLRIEDSETDRELTRSASRLSTFADSFWMGFRQGRGDEGWAVTRSCPEPLRKERQRCFTSTPLGDLYSALEGALMRVKPRSMVSKRNHPRSRTSSQDPANPIRSPIHRHGSDRKFVYWIERRNRGIFLRASPIDVAGLLQDKLFDEIPTVVLTSATLSSGGNFRIHSRSLGLDAADDLIAESTFDYESQAILYLPPRMPDPRSRDWSRSVRHGSIRILNATEGRAFVLSTSIAGMRALYEQVRPEIDYPSLLQGSGVEGAVVETFRETPTQCCLRRRAFGREWTYAGTAILRHH
jgi:ATP-dependent DNA helicase DinG